MEDVEAFGCKGESALAEGAYKRGIPHEVVGVHRAVAIATTGVLLEVGGKLNAERQLIGKRHAIVVVVGIKRLEVVAIACRVAPLCVGNKSQTQVALLERQLQIVAQYRCVDTAQYGGCVVDVGIVGYVEVGTLGVVERESCLYAK